MSCCTLLKEHQCSPGHPRALSVTLVPPLLADRVAARVNPAASATSVFTAHRKGGHRCASLYQQGWEVEMQTSSFGALLAGHMGKSSGFYIPAEQEMLSTSRASPLPLLRRGKIPPPLAPAKQAQSRRHLQSAGARLQDKDKPCHMSPQGDKAHTVSVLASQQRPAIEAACSCRQQLLLPGDGSWELWSSHRDSPGTQQTHGDSCREEGAGLI